MLGRFRDGYVTGPGGLRLYYRIDGDHGPLLVCCNGVGVPIYFWEPVALRLSREYQVVRWDYRGHGRSDSPSDPTDISVRTCTDDLAALMDGLKVDRAVLLGHSMATQVVFEYYRRHPERVAALVPTLGTFRHGITTFYDTRVSLFVFEAAKRAVEAAPMLFSRLSRPLLTSGVAERLARAIGIIDPSLAPHDLMVPYMEHLMRIDLRTFVTLAEDMERFDASEILPTIKVPTLIVAAERDRFTPARLGREMAARIPNAELLVIPNGTHAALIEQPDLLALRIDKFLDERVFPAASGAAK